MLLWTTWADYAATGEGHTTVACLGWAPDAAGAKEAFTKLFGEFIALGCETKVGVVRNEVTRFLFSEIALQNIELAEARGCTVITYAEMHINCS